MRELLAYLDGDLLPMSQLCLGAHDAGFVFGATVTDRCRTFRQRPYQLEAHLARFRQSCQAAEIPQPISDQELTRVVGRLLSENLPLLRPEQEVSILFFATPGPLAGFSGPGPGGPPTLGVETIPIAFERYAHLFSMGAKLLVPSIGSLPRSCLDPRIKHRSRLHWWLAEREVKQQDPEAMALLVDEDGNLTETASANFLIVKDGVVQTPPADRVLGGISLGVVRRLCGELGIEFVEKLLTPREALAADEAMLSCSTFCLARVETIHGRWYGPRPGPIYERLLAAWSQEVGLDIRAQFLTPG